MNSDEGDDRARIESECMYLEKQKEYFNAIKKHYNFSVNWEIFDDIKINEIETNHPFDAKFLFYPNTSVSVKIEGKNWLDLWKAADKILSTTKSERTYTITTFYEINNKQLVLVTDSF